MEGGARRARSAQAHTHTHTQPTLPREPPQRPYNDVKIWTFDLLEKSVYLCMCESTQACGDTLDLKGFIVVLSLSQASFALPLKHYSTQAC